MQYLHFIRSNLESTEHLAKALESYGVNEADIHVVGKNHYELNRAHLHEAGVLETTDMAHAFRTGVKIGVLAGILLGALVVFKIFPELSLGWGTIVGVAVFGAVFGGWVSSMIGIAVQNPLIEKFEKEIQKGHYLILVKVPEKKVKEIKKRFKLAV